MHLDLFFDHEFNFCSVKTDINENELNLINLEESEAPKTGLLISVNSFEFVII